MKTGSGRVSVLLAIAIVVVALTRSSRLAAQNGAVSGHHHYKLIDLGTFGGPQSHVNSGSGQNSPNFSSILNQSGTVTGWADTPAPDPFPEFCLSEECFVVHTFEWKNGVKTDLGVLPGGAGSESNWVTDNGLIAGLSENGEIDPLIPGFPEIRATLWRDGDVVDLGTLPEGGFESIANAANNRGQVVGFATNTTDDANSMFGSGFQTRAFLWEEGQMQDLGTLPGGTDAQAILINDNGQVVGWSYRGAETASLCPFPIATGSFIWDKENGLRDLGNLGGTCTIATDMNRRGQIIGASNLTGDASQHAFLWDKGAFQDLGGSLGGDFLGAFAINDEGKAVGFAYFAGDTVFHAVLWRGAGNLVDLGTVGGDTSSYAASINSKDQVVGSSGDLVSTFRVFLWENGESVDLNALVPPDSTLHLEFAQTINDRGEIAGTGVGGDNEEHAFLAVPCDERHPNIEGCDYSLAEPSPVATAKASAPVTLRAGTGAATLSTHSGSRWGRPLWIRRYQDVTPLRKQAIAAALPSGPNATLSPSSLIFSTRAIGTTSSAKTITLTNPGAASLGISSIAITGTNAGDFSQTHTCGSSLASTAKCTISVSFKPTASGTRTAAVSVTDNASGTPQKVALSGTGTAAKLSTGSLGFGVESIGTASGGKSVTLTNVGTTGFNITAIAITGANAGDYLQTHTCGSSLGASASCTITVTFKPTASGTRTAALSLSDSAAGSPQTVALSGSGTAAKVSPSGLNFGTVVVGSSSGAQAMTLSNVGTSIFDISAIAIAGPDPGDFSQTHTCGTSLAPSASCTISVSFKPTATSARTAAINITDTAVGSPQTMLLSGAGASAIASLTITSGAPPSGRIGRIYDFHCTQIPLCNVFVAGFPLSAAGGVPPYSWSWAGAAGSSIPPGLSLHVAGGNFGGCLNVAAPAICGTPTTAGTYRVIVAVSDSGNPPNHASATYSITVFSQ